MDCFGTLVFARFRSRNACGGLAEAMAGVLILLFSRTRTEIDQVDRNVVKKLNKVPKIVLCKLWRVQFRGHKHKRQVFRNVPFWGYQIRTT